MAPTWATWGLPLPAWARYEQAVDLLTEAVAVSRDIGDRQLEASTWATWDWPLSLGEYERAIDLHAQALAVFRDIGDRQGEGIHLGNLGNCRYAWASTQQAIDLHTHALAIARDIGNRQAEGMTLGNLGNCRSTWATTGRPSTCTPRPWPSPAIGDRQREGADLGNLGNCHSSLGDYRQATDLHTQALDIARDIGDRQAEGAALGNLGNLPRQPGRLPAGDRPARPGPGDRPRHRRPLRRGDRASLSGPGLAGVGRARRAVMLLEQAVSIADTPVTSSRRWRPGRPGAGPLQLGDPAAALAATTAGRAAVVPDRGTSPAAAGRAGPARAAPSRGERAGVPRRGHRRRRAAGTRGQQRCRAAGPCPRAERTRRGTGDPARAAEAAEAFARA